MTEIALVIEDEEALRIIVSKMLSHIGYDTRLVSSLNEALEKLENEKFCPDVVILDMNFPDSAKGVVVKDNGLKIIQYLNDNSKNIPVIVMSGLGIISRLPKVSYKVNQLPKPFSIKDLERLVPKGPKREGSEVPSLYSRNGSLNSSKLENT